MSPKFTMVKGMQQFESLNATELYCPRCRVAQPVREKLLLVLPHAELHDYRCQACGESVGTREVTAPPPMPAAAPPPKSAPAARPSRPGRA
jgi:hypothetical protein